MADKSEKGDYQSPSELSLALFLANAEADKTLPEAVRNGIVEAKAKGVGALLAAIRATVEAEPDAN